MKPDEVKKILDVTCGGRSIWFNKNHPAAIYCDKREECSRIWKSGDGKSERTITVSPDVVCDFTDLPFGDNSFALVVFDPPHLQKVSETKNNRIEIMGGITPADGTADSVLGHLTAEDVFARIVTMHKTESTHDTADRCVCCGDVIPEGRMVCPKCEGGGLT